MQLLTSPFSKGTIREYSVVQMAWSSLVIRSTVCSPNFSMQSLLEAVHQAEKRGVR